MPVKKLKIFGIVNSGNSNYFVIEKRQKFFKGMRNLLRGIGFNGLWWNSLGRPIGSHGEYNFNKETPIRRFKDGFKYMVNEDSQIAIFYGGKKILVSVYCSAERRKALMKNLLKFCYVTKPRAVKK